jgi:hypothetical protein
MMRGLKDEVLRAGIDFPRVVHRWGTSPRMRGLKGPDRQVHVERVVEGHPR